MTTLILQPDSTTGKDTMVSSANPTINYGAAAGLYAGTAHALLIEFDLSSIPAGATCLSATLALAQDTPGAAAAYTINAYSIAIGNAAWIEGTKNGLQAGAGEPCWNALAADGAGGVTTAWAGGAGLPTPGTDYEAALLGSVAANRADPAGTIYSISLSPARVRGWFGATNTNYGLKIVATITSGALASSNNSTAARRPKLTLEYILGGASMAGLLNKPIITAPQWSR